MSPLTDARSGPKALLACACAVFLAMNAAAEAAVYRVAIIASPGGTVQTAEKSTAGPETPLELVATAKPGYVFACWAAVTNSDIAISDIRAARTSLLARSDGTVEAIFVPKTRAGWIAIAIVLPGHPYQVFTVPIGKAARLSISGYPPRPAAGEIRFSGWKILTGQASQISDPQTTPRLEAKGLASITVETAQGPLVIRGDWHTVLDPKPTD
jgi:hypothetical protein